MIPRLYIDSPLQGKGSVLLNADQGHYLKNVLRRKSGDSILVFNGQDGEWRGIITGAEKKSTHIELQEKTRHQNIDQNLILLCPLIKKDPLDWLVQKATELGVSEIFLILTDRTNASHTNVDRLIRIAIEAAEQSGRLTLPVIHPPQNLRHLLKGWDESRLILMGDERHPEKKFTQALTDSFCVLVGPEGGFSDAEREDLGRLPFIIKVDLGSGILKTETAALSMLAGVKFFKNPVQ